MAYPAPSLLGSRDFRILNLLPGSLDDVITFSLQSATCDSEPQLHYEALSYAWGDLDLKHEIFCEDSGLGDSGSLMVTTNCHNALKSLRLLNRTRSLWIDAICINQEDLKERAVQVGNMRSIYCGACQVVIYLGESDDDSDSVMRHLQDRFEPIDYPRRDTFIPNPSKEEWQRFSSRAWFTRTWVLQELYSAKQVEVRCGRVSVSWEALEDYYRSYRSSDHRLQFRVPAVHKVMAFASRDRRPSGDETGQRLLKLLVETRQCLSSDPRDKLYGILPMLGTDRDLPFLRPDYHRPVNELFTDIALFLYDQIGSEVFRQASRSHTKGGLELLPTWVPDWTRADVRAVERRRGHVNMRNLVQRLGAENDLLNDARPSGYPDMHGSIIRQLIVKGMCFGSLTLISDECDLDENVFPLARWRNVALGLNPSASESTRRKGPEASPEGEPLAQRRDVFHRLLVDDFVVYAHVLYRALDRIIEWEKDGSSEKLVKLLTRRQCPSYLQQILRLLKCCDKRKLAILQNGMLGLVPVHAELDDLLYLLPGASVPFLFRKRGDHYVFVGECSVQDIMFEEAGNLGRAELLDTLIVE